MYAHSLTFFIAKKKVPYCQAMTLLYLTFNNKIYLKFDIA